LKKINGQLLQHGVIPKYDAGIMDASITESLFVRKARRHTKLLKDRKEHERSEEETQKETQTIKNCLNFIAKKFIEHQ
jgi:hypothetical protein